MTATIGVAQVGPGSAPLLIRLRSLDSAGDLGWSRWRWSRAAADHRCTRTPPTGRASTSWPGSPSSRSVTTWSPAARNLGVRAQERPARAGQAGAAQALLRAGELDELKLHVVPVLLGKGRRLFDNLAAEHIELDLVRLLTTPGIEDFAHHVMHLRYRRRR